MPRVFLHKGTPRELIQVATGYPRASCYIVDKDRDKKIAAMNNNLEWLIGQINYMSTKYPFGVNFRIYNCHEKNDENSKSIGYVLKVHSTYSRVDKHAIAIIHENLRKYPILDKVIDWIAYKNNVYDHSYHLDILVGLKKNVDSKKLEAVSKFFKLLKIGFQDKCTVEKWLMESELPEFAD